MVRWFVVRWFVLAAVAGAGPAHAQPARSTDEIARVDTAVRAAFAFLYALPSDTAGAPMGSWVLDSAATTGAGAGGRRRIVATRLADTGQDLKLDEIAGRSGTTPAELAASMAAVQRLEGQISKAEADATLEILVTVNDEELTAGGVSDEAARSRPAVPDAGLALRVAGDWMRVDDRELGIDYQRWSPGTLLVGFGSFGPVETRRASPKEHPSTVTARAHPPAGAPGIHTIAVVVQGNETMIDRVIAETDWSALRGLLR